MPPNSGRQIRRAGDIFRRNLDHRVFTRCLNGRHESTHRKPGSQVFGGDTLQGRHIDAYPTDDVVNDVLGAKVAKCSKSPEFRDSRNRPGSDAPTGNAYCAHDLYLRVTAIWGSFCSCPLIYHNQLQGNSKMHLSAHFVCRITSWRNAPPYPSAAARDGVGSAAAGTGSETTLTR